MIAIHTPIVLVHHPVPVVSLGAVDVPYYTHPSPLHLSEIPAYS
jgi:hypothetical protein